MAETVMMPKLGFDMAEGTLVRWVKKEGDSVNKGDVLAEIETDKATVEVESSFSGVVARHLVAEGASVPVGDPIAVVGQPGEKVEDSAPAEPKEARQPAAAAQLTTEQKAPRADEKQQTATGSVPAAEIAPAEVQTVQGAPTSTPQQYEAAAQGAPSGATVTAPAEGQPLVEGELKASPLARRVAQDNGLDLRAVTGSGPGGRIVRKDVEAALKAPRPAAAAAVAQPAPAAAPVAAQAAPAAKAPAVSIPMPAFGQVQVPEDTRTQPDKLRTIIGKRMQESKQAVPHFYITSEYRMDELMALRKQVNGMLADDQKLSVNDFIIKAVALALRAFPNINASLDGNEIVRHGHVNVGVAVALDNGLMTVVCNDADQKPLRVIAEEVRQLVARARSGKVRPDDIQGSTFSISNLGMYQVEEFIAIINPPEAAILAVGSAQEVPVVENGEIKVGWRMKATISADHRLTDGAEAAKFMQALRGYIESPMSLLL
jgi:pyruvate dehydrogenase E2 component (dihydrolipoamide acetyltransferase)